MSKDTTTQALSPEDGTRDDLTELLREGAKRLIAEAVDTELTTMLGQLADYKEQAGRRYVVRIDETDESDSSETPDLSEMLPSDLVIKRVTPSLRVPEEGQYVRWEVKVRDNRGGDSMAYYVSVDDDENPGSIPIHEKRTSVLARVIPRVVSLSIKRNAVSPCIPWPTPGTSWMNLLKVTM